MRNEGGSRRWQMIGVYLGLWCSMSFCLLIWPPSCIKSVSSSAFYSQLLRDGLPIKGCAVNMTIVLITQHYNGAANIKNNILVPNVSFSSPNGGTVLVPPL
jgi:hypothetical protein